jgi:hypothetical protein
MVLIFVPFDRTRQHFGARLRESLAAVATPAAREQHAPSEPKPSNDESPPFWTWFLPNRCPPGQGG